MMTFLAILGILFIITLIGFFTSNHFKEFQRERKPQPKNKNPYLTQQTVTPSKPYYDTIRNIRTDGYYLLKGDNYIYVYAYLTNGNVAWFSEFTLGNSVAERILLAKSVHEAIANPKVWAKHNSIEGNEIVSVFKIDDETKTLRSKIKSNGQLQVFLTYNDFDGQKVTEWYDYDFINTAAIRRHREKPLTTRVLPIVGLDVGAIGSISLSALVRAEGTLLNIRINF